MGTPPKPDGAPDLSALYAVADDIASSALDLLVAEASFDETQLFMHMSLEDTGKLAGETEPGALLLVHFYPEVEDKTPYEIRRVIGRYYHGPVYVAHDGLALWKDAAASAWRWTA